MILLTLIVLTGGLALVLVGRRRGFGRGTAVIIAIVVAAASFAHISTGRADASACPPTTSSTTTSIAAGPIAPTTTAVTTTLAPTTTAVTTTLAPTTTAVTTTTLAPTTSTTTTSTTTTTTTTTVPLVPDLTPDIAQTGGSVFIGQYAITITNLGDAPTTGPMSFTLTLAVVDGPGPVVPSQVASADWTSVPSPSGLTFTSIAGLVIAPGATSVVTLQMTWNVEAPGSWQGTVTLPTGIGGETNAANNTASITVVIPPP